MASALELDGKNGFESAADVWIMFRATSNARYVKRSKDEKAKLASISLLPGLKTALESPTYW